MAVGSSSASPAKVTDGEFGGPDQVSNQPEVAVARTEASNHGEEAGSTKYCHQCHQRTAGIFPACKKQTKGKFCNTKYCQRCLWNRYKEKAEEVTVLETWCCPKCRGSCNCCMCRRKQGSNPSGKVETAEASGSSALELVGEEGPLNLDVGCSLKKLSAHPKDDITHENPADVLPKGQREGSSSTSKQDKKRKRAKGGCITGMEDGSSVNKKKSRSLPCKESVPQVVLPQGTELTGVAGIDLHPEDISQALQFLEFCASFGKCLDLKEGEAECILRELASGGRACQRKMSLSVHFNKLLLSFLQEDLEEKNSPVTPRAGKNSWLHDLRRFPTRSSFLPQSLDLEQLSAEDGYDNLSFSEKLRLLNFLCDESLNSKKIRSWMEEKLKNEHGKVLAKNHNKLKIDEPLAKDVDHEEALTETQVEAAIGGITKSKGIVRCVKQGLNSFRREPIRLGVNGRICWRLNCFADASNLFIEEVGSSDGRSEKWLTYNVEEEKEIERYLVSVRKREKSRKVVVDDLTNNPGEDEEAIRDLSSNNEHRVKCQNLVVDDLTNNSREDEEAIRDSSSNNEE